MLVLEKLARQGSCRGCGGRPGRGLAGGVHLALLLFVFLVLALLDCLVASASLLYPAKCGRRRDSDCPCTDKGVQGRAPTSVHRQEPSGLGHT